MRHACGSNDHSHPQTFLQLYRLLSTYSLVKPSKGSSVAGSEMLNALLDISDVTDDVDSRSSEFRQLLDEILDKGVELRTGDIISEALENFKDHEYDLITSSNFIIGYVAGTWQFYFYVCYCNIHTSDKIVLMFIFDAKKVSMMILISI